MVGVKGEAQQRMNMTTLKKRTACAYNEKDSNTCCIRATKAHPKKLTGCFKNTYSNIAGSMVPLKQSGTPSEPPAEASWRLLEQ